MKWGRVGDVYIPPRRDKLGKRFGFVKFINVQNPKVLERQLENIMIGDQKLVVSIPRYERNIARELHVNPQRNRAGKIGDNKLRNGVSYVAVTKGDINVNNPHNGGIRDPRVGRMQNCQNSEWMGLFFNTIEEDVSWLKGCYVAETFNPKGVQSLQNNLHLEGVFTIIAIPMGGNLVLLKPTEEGVVE